MAPKSLPTTLNLMFAKSDLSPFVRGQEGLNVEFAPDIRDAYTLYFKPEIPTLLGHNKRLISEFYRWAKPLIKSSHDRLSQIYLDYGILPHCFLEILGRHKANQLAEDLDVKVKLRRRKEREHDEILIKEAARLVLMWLPYTPLIEKELDRTYIAASLITRLADSLPLLGPSAAHRPKRSRIYSAALELYEVCETLIGAPQTRSTKISYYQGVGDLLQKAYPEEYVFHSDRDLGKMLTRARKQRSLCGPGSTCTDARSIDVMTAQK